MVRAYGRAPTPEVMDRLRNSDFWGLYDREPVGAIVVTMDSEYSPGIHIGCVRAGRCGAVTRRVVDALIKQYGCLYAELNLKAARAIRLAKGLGFIPVTQTETHLVCRRQA